LRIFSTKKNHQKSSDRREVGSVLIEMSIVLPVCLLFFLGIIEIGRLLAQYSWVQQTTYNAAFLGSGMTESLVGTDPTRVAKKLFDNLNYSKNALTDPEMSANYNGISQTVEISIQSNLNLLTNFYPIDVDVTSTAPSVIVNFDAGDPKVFANSDPEAFFDCDGNPCADGTACGAAICP